MSGRRAGLVRYLERNGYSLVREGAKHSIYSNDAKTIPVKRHNLIDRITANALCKQASLAPKF